jgi:glycosyltransferase involved in cell wall biosynthesis
VKLVIMIPALNEEKTIGDVIRRIPRDIEGIAATEVIVIDDGSTDRTAELARAAGAQVISHHSNRGVGAALATGMDAALRRGADLIVNMDGDGQFSPEDTPALVEPILKRGYGFATCTRFARAELIPEMRWVNRWGNKMMCRLVNWIIWGANFTDVSCGFRAYSRDTALQLNLFGRFSYTQEMFIDLASRDIRMTEVPLRVRGIREFGQSRVAGSLFHYARRAITIIVRAMRDTRPLKFFGGIGLSVAMIGVVLGLIVFGFWVATRRTNPVKSLLIGSSVFLTLGFLLCTMALMADMIGRLRRTLEDVRYTLRRIEYGDLHANLPGAPATERTGEKGLPPE